MLSSRPLLIALCLSLPACSFGSDELAAYRARMEACGAHPDDFRVSRRSNGSLILTPWRPDDAMAGEYGDRQQCVTSWARSNGFEVTASHWGASK